MPDMSLDLARTRRETPTCEAQTFLDSAGSALSPTIVNETLIAHLKLEQEVGGYVAAAQVLPGITDATATVGALVGAAPHQIAWQPSATAAWNRAISSIPFRDGDRVLTTSAEYASNVIPLLQAHKKVGLEIDVIPDGPDGAADPIAFDAMLDDRVRAVAITHAPSQNGLLVDAQAFGDVLRARNSNAWFLLDACQSVGQMPIEMGSIGADFVSATGRKWIRGPRGTGFLAVSDRALGELEPDPMDMCGAMWLGGTDYQPVENATRFQSFEMSIAGLLGLGAAAAYALELGLDQIRNRVSELASGLREDLDRIAGVRVLDRGSERTGIVTFAVPGDNAFVAANELRASGVT
ncbi:MAG: aminotransferase class V-fold PLP-dependent enzyme, partial [Actinobacteria bacterium]|nr:aminotransferase class V-fold PLP-dependent enzyme [Actinomycetota bacterium]